MRRSAVRPDGLCSGERGFALVLVIWGLGLIALIALTVVTTERYRILAAANMIENAKAEALAEAGVNLLRLELRAATAVGLPSNAEAWADIKRNIFCDMMVYVNVDYIHRYN